MPKALVTLLLLALVPALGQAEIGMARKTQLLNMLKQDCGSCHGLTLKGGLGPALTPGALKGKPRALILGTILDGRPGTPMPPWRPILTREEAVWLVDRLYKGDTDAP